MTMPRAARAKTASPPMMSTREVAAYLRLSERRIYDLVRMQALPHVRATGKLLFPRVEVDAWLATKSSAAPGAHKAAPPIIAGSHDPLLEWAVREAGHGLAVLACGSSAGLDRLAAGEAAIAAMHWRDATSGEYNVPLVRDRLTGSDVVVVEWAHRKQGLLLARGNPLKIRTLADLVKRKARVIDRQGESGSHELLQQLCKAARVAPESLQRLPRPARAETDIAAAIRDGKADAGVAIEAASRAFGLAFIALATERFDLVMRRRDYFEPPMQALLAFARTAEFRERAAALGGYDVTQSGRIVYNA